MKFKWNEKHTRVTYYDVVRPLACQETPPKKLIGGDLINNLLQAIWHTDIVTMYSYSYELQINQEKN